MKIHLNPRCFVVLNYMLFSLLAETAAQPNSAASLLHKPSLEKGLFDSDEVLHITLKGNIREVLQDRSGDPKNYAVLLSYSIEPGSEKVIPVQIKTRGHFRRIKENCTYPPLLIQFSKDGAKLSSAFKEQAKLKLVMPCMGDEYLIREWLVYKIYNLVTPKSFRARLVKVKLDDDKNKKPIAPFYGILLEEEKQMAKRNQCVPVEKKLQPEQTQADAFLSLAVFEYLAGNTDWSVQYLQNIKLIAKDSNAVPVAVPYDFDHAGIVKTPYAVPAVELQINSVRDRRYRGYCVQNEKLFEPVIADYNRLKKGIYSLYTDCPLLDDKYIKSTTQYLDEFYATINNAKTWKKEFGYPCDKNGTGNVVIKGLKKD